MTSSSPYLLPEREDMTPRTPPQLIDSDQNMDLDISSSSSSSLSTSPLSIDSTQWTPKAIVAEVAPTRRRSDFVIVSPLFRGTFDEMDRDHTVDPIVVGGTSASEWHMSREWKDLVARQIEAEIDEADAFEDEEEVLRLQREVAFLQHLDQQQYFVQDLGRLGPSINVRIIREDIQERLAAHLRNEASISSPPWIPTSPLSSVVVSSPPAKSVIKPLPKSERLQIATRQVIKDGRPLTQAATAFGVNRGTLLDRVKNKRLAAVDYGKKCRLLDEAEESALLQFIDRYCKLGFPPRYEMVRDKAMKLRALRVEDPNPIGLHWVSRFLNRYPDYKSRFPRHLDQERHWNTEPKVFEDWFKLYQQTMEEFHIATGDVYNMDEKGHLMGMAGNVK